jgi:hypothetical protein
MSYSFQSFTYTFLHSHLIPLICSFTHHIFFSYSFLIPTSRITLLHFSTFLPSFSSTHPLSPSYSFLPFYLLFFFPTFLPSSSFTPSLTLSYNPSPSFFLRQLNYTLTLFFFHFLPFYLSSLPSFLPLFILSFTNHSFHSHSSPSFYPPAELQGRRVALLEPILRSCSA